MQSYIGTKVIQATPMTDAEFTLERSEFQKAKNLTESYEKGHNLFRGIAYAKLPVNTTPVPEPKEGYKVMYEDGYISWSLKEVFERCYRLITETEKKIVRGNT